MPLKAELQTIGLVSILVAGADTVQSFWLQKVSINVYSEANMLPFDFYKYGVLGYIAYWPIDAVFNFVLLLFFWGLSRQILKVLQARFK